MDRDPNQLAFNLRCEHCQHTFRSQGSLRAHLKHGEPRCRRFCIRCGCCAQLYLSKDQLAAHLNQPGRTDAPQSFHPPLQPPLPIYPYPASLQLLLAQWRGRPILRLPHTPWAAVYPRRSTQPRQPVPHSHWGQSGRHPGSRIRCPSSRSCGRSLLRRRRHLVFSS